MLGLSMLHGDQVVCHPDTSYQNRFAGATQLVGNWSSVRKKEIDGSIINHSKGRCMKYSMISDNFSNILKVNKHLKTV